MKRRRGVAINKGRYNERKEMVLKRGDPWHLFVSSQKHGDEEYRRRRSEGSGLRGSSSSQVSHFLVVPPPAAGG